MPGSNDTTRYFLGDRSLVDGSRMILAVKMTVLVFSQGQSRRQTAVPYVKIWAGDFQEILLYLKQHTVLGMLISLSCLWKISAFCSSDLPMGPTLVENVRLMFPDFLI